MICRLTVVFIFQMSNSSGQAIEHNAGILLLFVISIVLLMYRSSLDRETFENPRVQYVTST